MVLPKFDIREFFVFPVICPLNARIFVIPYTKIIKMKEAIKWQKKDLTKIDLELEEAKKKVASLENERKLAEEKLQKRIGKIYVQIQLKKDKNQSYESILDDLKTELAIIKEDEKARREAAKKERGEGE